MEEEVDETEDDTVKRPPLSRLPSLQDEVSTISSSLSSSSLRKPFPEGGGLDQLHLADWWRESETAQRLGGSMEGG